METYRHTDPNINRHRDTQEQKHAQVFHSQLDTHIDIHSHPDKCNNHKCKYICHTAHTGIHTQMYSSHRQAHTDTHTLRLVLNYSQLT